MHIKIGDIIKYYNSQSRISFGIVYRIAEIKKTAVGLEKEGELIYSVVVLGKESYDSEEILESDIRSVYKDATRC